MDNYLQATPSIKTVFLTILIYLTAPIPSVIGIAYSFAFIGYSSQLFYSNISEITLSVQICITISLIIFLVKRYHIFLFTNSWKGNISRNLKVGLKWALPLVVIHTLSLIIPFWRDKLVGKYLSLDIISIKEATEFTLILFSSWLLIGAIFEELFYRGILIQKLQKHINDIASLLFAAGIFALSHFIFTKVIFGSLISSFLVGSLCGFAFLSTRSCISATLPHLMNNMVCAGIVWVIWFNK